ncbi:Fic family protein [Patescibacteria group bacterium]|nr:Fic family protein [Patescibacteria group bacterium]
MIKTKKKLNKRQLEVLEFIKNNPDSNNSTINDFINDSYEETSRVTIVRDLNFLLKEKLIIKNGEGRNITYKELLENTLLFFLDVDKYFKKDSDKRDVAYKKFNFDVFNHLDNIFSKREIEELEKLNNNYQRNHKKLSKTILKKELERLTIELSWKSSKIEGNTYSLIDTEILIKENKEAKGHKKEEAIMILNHKKTLDYILDNLKRFKKLDIKDIEDVHKIIVKDLDVAVGIRKGLVGITGTVYRPLDNQHQIKEGLERMVKELNNVKDNFSKALLVILLLSYLQPFEDGNKRTARMMANAVLLANNICPLSFRSIDEADYKKAVVLFYEQNGARFFKELFVEQFRFSVKNYFLSK